MGNVLPRILFLIIENDFPCGKYKYSDGGGKL